MHIKIKNYLKHYWYLLNALFNNILWFLSPAELIKNAQQVATELEAKYPYTENLIYRIKLKLTFNHLQRTTVTSLMHITLVCNSLSLSNLLSHALSHFKLTPMHIQALFSLKRRELCDHMPCWMVKYWN